MIEIETGSANVYADLGEKQKALDYFNQALPIYRAVGDRDYEALTLTSIDGVYTADPRRDQTARLIERVQDAAELRGFDITQHTSAHGSGGMRSKVLAAEMASAAGIETTICNGARDGVLPRVLAGEHEGTRFSAHATHHSSFKLWLMYAKPSQGTVVVDAGAAAALRDGGTSLLPVGVTEVRGKFEAGDAVDVKSGGELLGKGICNYSAPELRRVKGLKSAAVHELLPDAADEAVHRDYLVLK